MTGRGGRAARGRGEQRGAGPGRRLRWRLAAVVVIAGLAAGVPLPAGAFGPGGPDAFGLNPAPNSSGRPEAYFNMTVAAGQSAVDTIIISNMGHKTEKLKLGRSLGVTAPNGGAAYSRAYQRCAGPGCWVTSLPRTVTLAAGAHEMLNFTVHVPAGTAHGQYLAGITAELAAKPKPVKVGSNGKATAKAIIVAQVTVGVAVTVGKLSKLTARLQIPGVTGEAIGPTARLNIQLQNTGQTFSGAQGKASCTAAGQRHSYAVFADTILPHDRAQIAVNAPGLPEGATVPCSVLLRYGKGRSVPWAGLVTLPEPPHARIAHTAPGAYSVVPGGGMPGWAIVLIIVGGLCLAVMVLLLLRLRRLNRSG